METRKFINYPKGVKGVKGIKGIPLEELKELLTTWGETLRIQRARRQGFRYGLIIGFLSGLLAFCIYLLAVSI